ncbi:FtsW/RodA/SpoVE family cell cycle protein [Bulleidia sp. zg-1006]|uniref:FtsW/RodA/SpoVE family cell cycle protein n=1 Tax=Bulleidia sp. zg-1006 TaxID=2806552 RepID=UPI00193ACE09|nr:FtsW/RodA/SpoVE family cell cycle protein [Bulleidia sp. zg-1006]QRG87078.1 FtsW/RodA/SpoVE family cell cycle protein [Bulleidia sp. zg-1006]
MKENSYRYIILAMLLEIAMAILLWFKDSGVALQFFWQLLPIFLITLFLGTFIYNRLGDLKLFLAICVLSTIGLAFQMYADKVYPIVGHYSLWKFWLGIVVGVFFTLLYKYIYKISYWKYSPYLFFLFSMTFYVILRFKGFDPNGYGTTAWLKVGVLTLQLTDGIKILSLFFYSSLLVEKWNRSNKVILIISSTYLGMNLIGSMMIHELGSFYILVFLHLACLFIYLPHDSYKRKYLFTLVGILALSILLFLGLYQVLKPITTQGQLNSITKILWPIAKKIHSRFSIATNLQSDPYGAGYQLFQGQKALLMAGWFGNTIGFNQIPVVESDMAFVGLVNCFGYSVGLLVLLLFGFILRRGSRISQRLLSISIQKSIFSYGLTMLVFLQAFLTILGSCNIIPLAGLPIPFLSRGGTYQMIVFSLMGVLLLHSLYGVEDMEEESEVENDELESE